MKKVVALVLVAVMFVICVAFGLRYIGNKLEEASVKHTITNAVVWVAKVSNGGYNIHIEINGEEYIHFASELAEEVE